MDSIITIWLHDSRVDKDSIISPLVSVPSPLAIWGKLGADDISGGLVFVLFYGLLCFGDHLSHRDTK